jgi:ribonucleotide reductase alpha subunit
LDQPGIAFIDEVNRHNHMMNSMGPIYSCNPCGEQFLHFSNSCNLGSIDLAKFYDSANDRIDWGRLREVTHLSTRFLDNVIDTCAWPLPEINDVVHRTRPVGLGVMGFADLCLTDHRKIGELPRLQFHWECHVQLGRVCFRVDDDVVGQVALCKVGGRKVR